MQHLPMLCSAFARLANKVNKKLRKGSLWTVDRLTNYEISAYEIWKLKLLGLLALGLPRLQIIYSIETDACNKQMGLLFCKIQPGGTDWPMRYLSHSLKEAKCVYYTTYRECIAVVQAVFLLWPHFGGFWFTVQSDQDALKFIPDRHSLNSS